MASFLILYSRLLRPCCICLCLLCTCLCLNAQHKRALIIGLGVQADKSWGKINGDKDVYFVKNMLVPSGFTDVTTLVNEKATKEAIINEFVSLANRSKEGDYIYIHFSGHGQQMTDLNKDESDRYDESWIPYDAYRSYCQKDVGNKHLCDDEISSLLTSIRKKVGLKGRIIVVVDACHSGDSSKGFGDEPTSSSVDYDSTGYVIRGVIDRFVIPNTGSTVNLTEVEENWITISACESYQLNVELSDPQVGRLTYAIYNIWKQNKQLTNNQFLAALTELMNQGNKSMIKQTPIITGKVHVANILQTIK